jgi:hypothetical protein
MRRNLQPSALEKRLQAIDFARQLGAFLGPRALP